MSYGINKFGDKATVENELNMNGNSTVGLPTHIGVLSFASFGYNGIDVGRPG